MTLGLTSGAQPTGGDTYAVVLGIDEYVHNTVPTLRYAVADAKLFAQSLQDAVHVPKDHIVVMTSDVVDENLQPKATNVAFQVGNLKGKVKPTDTLIFYFAGHGVTVGDDSYLLTEEADNRNLATLKLSALRGKDLTDFLRDAGAGRVIVMVDACRNSPSKPSASLDFAYPPLGAGTGKTDSATMFACSVGERSWEWDEKKHGFFTWFLVQGLCRDAAESSGQVTLQSLKTFVSRAVPEAALKITSAKQTPNISYQGPGDDRWIMSIVAAPAHVAATGVRRDADESKLVATLEATRAQLDAEHNARVAAESRLAQETSRRAEVEQRLAILEKLAPGGATASTKLPAAGGQMLAYADRGAPGISDAARTQALEAEVSKLKSENEALKARLSAAQGQIKEVGMASSSREVQLLEEECQKSEAQAKQLDAKAGASLDERLAAQVAERAAMLKRLEVLGAQYGESLAARNRDPQVQKEVAAASDELEKQHLVTTVAQARSEAAEGALREAQVRVREAEIRVSEYQVEISNLQSQNLQLQNELKKLREQVATLSRDLDKSETENHRLREDLRVAVGMRDLKAHEASFGKQGDAYWRVSRPHHSEDFTNIRINVREATEADFPQPAKTP